MMKYDLSPSTLKILKDCPRCFWLHFVAKVRRPKGIFPSLPNGVDKVTKEYCDRFRAAGQMPPELKELRGTLMTDQAGLDKWREWRSTPLVHNYTDERVYLSLSGALDDCIVEEEGGVKYYIPLDYKTKGSGPKPEDPPDGLRGYMETYYADDQALYNLMLSSSGYRVRGKAIIYCMWPEEMGQNGILKLGHQVVEIDAPVSRAMAILERAAAVLSSPSMPEAAEKCEHCNFVKKYNGEAGSNGKKESKGITEHAGNTGGVQERGRVSEVKRRSRTGAKAGAGV